MRNEEPQTARNPKQGASQRETGKGLTEKGKSVSKRRQRQMEVG